MLYNILLVIVLIPVLLGFGEIFQKIFGKIWEGISSKIFSGIFFLAVFWQILVFCFPISVWVEISCLVVGAASFIYYKSYQLFSGFSKRSFLFLTSLVLISSFFASFFAFIFDHFGYYVPSIKWLKEYGLIKGIANLDWILGQMSIWHTFQAGFSNVIDPYLRINLIVLVTFFIYIIEKKTWAMLLCAPVLYLFLQSPSPDLPSIVFSLILLNEILLKNKNIELLFAFSVFVFSIKPTMVWLPLWTLLYGFFILKKNVKFVFFGSFVFALYVAKNILILGLPFYPVNVFNLNFSWIPNDGMLLESHRVAMEKTFDMQYDLEQIEGFSKYEYVKNWLLLPGIKGFINLSFIILLFILGMFSVLKKQKIIFFLFLAILAKSLFVLFFSAQYRFFIDVFFVGIFILLMNLKLKKIMIGSFLILSVISASIFVFPSILKNNISSFRLGSYFIGFHKSQLIVPSYYKLEKYRTYKLGNLVFYMVQGFPFTFDTKLPAISPHFAQSCLKYNIFPQKLGTHIKSGFVWKTLSLEDRKMLEKIVKEQDLEKYGD